MNERMVFVVLIGFILMFDSIFDLKKCFISMMNVHLEFVEVSWGKNIMKYLVGRLGGSTLQQIDCYIT